MSARDADRDAVGLFFDALKIAPRKGGLRALGAVAEAFSTLPYENISKVLKTTRGEGPEDWRRLPSEVIRDHLRHGLGGTCFSLSNYLARIVNSLGFETRFVLADTPGGKNHHCALLTRQGNETYLIDPGYLICEPIQLPDNSVEIATSRGTLRLERNHENGRFLLSSPGETERKIRYELHAAPATEAAFRNAWDDSFEWPGMRQLVITRHTQDGQLYLHNRHFRRIRTEGVEKRNLRENLEETAGDAFGIDPEKIRRARSLLNERRPGKKI